MDIEINNNLFSGINMNAILNWMSSATEHAAITVSDNLGGDLICKLSTKDIQIEGSNDILFHIFHKHKEFLLISNLSNYTLICSRSN